MSVDNVSSRAVLTRVGTAGWVGWSALAMTMVASTLAASLQRRVGVCATQGWDNPRRWVFRLVPLGQTCADEPTVGELVLHSSATIVAVFAAIAGASAALVLLLRRLSTALPPMDGWLLRCVAVGIILAVIAGISQAATGFYSDPQGASLGITVAVSVAFTVGFLGTGVVGVIRSYQVDR